MVETDYAWAAGFLDGEGCFTSGSNGKSYMPLVAAAQVDKRPLDRLQKLLGGNVVFAPYGSGNRRHYYRWSASGGLAIRRILPEILPYLTTKREQAETLLTLSFLIRPNSAGHKRLSVGERYVRQVLVDRLKAAKR